MNTRLKGAYGNLQMGRKRKYCSAQPYLDYIGVTDRERKEWANENKEKAMDKRIDKDKLREMTPNDLKNMMRSWRTVIDDHNEWDTEYPDEQAYQAILTLIDASDASDAQGEQKRVRVTEKQIQEGIDYIKEYPSYKRREQWLESKGVEIINGEEE